MSNVKEVLVLHHSHLDVGYTHPQPTLWELQRDYIDEAIQLCEETADWPEACKFRWTCEATAPVLKWLETASDSDIVRFERLLQSGQMSIAAMNMHTSPLCNAEQLTRMLYPVRTLRERFGIALNTAINHDINGQPWPLSQILLDAGIDLYITGINCHFGGIPLQRPRAFWWEAPDKRRLLSFLGEHYSIFTQVTKAWEKDTNVMAQGLNKYIQRIEGEGYPYDFIYLTSTNLPMFDNTPPDHDLAQLIRTWNQEGREQTIRFVTPETLYVRLQQVNPDTIQTYAGDWTDFWNFGSASSALETRLNRRTKQALKTAELLEAFGGAESNRLAPIKRDAWNFANLYDEHTWGASNSVTNPDSIYTKAQWVHKSNYAFEANSLASYVIGKQLETFTGNALQSETPAGILLVNPTGVKQVYDLRIPDDYQAIGRHLSANRYRFFARNEDQDWSSKAYGLVELQPFSWLTIPFRELTEVANTDAVVVTDDVIETPYYRVTYSLSAGIITGIYDKRLDWHVLDQQSDYAFFHFVRETIDVSKAPQHRRSLYDRDIDKCNNSISCWNPEWPADRSGATELTACYVETHPTGATLVTTWNTETVRDLEQRITFFAHKPGIELRASFYKEDVREPESIYFTFPLNLKQWEAKYDTAEMFVRLDEDQLQGSCRDWITVDRTVSMFDRDKGVTLACPDAPMVQVGGFNFGREHHVIPRGENPLLLAWPMNNYWDTNFRASQPGHFQVKYELTTFDVFNPTNAWAAGVTADNPVEIWPVTSCDERRSGSFIALEGEGLVITHVKPAEDGNGVLLRVRNHSDESVEGEIRLPDRGVVSAWYTTGLEENKREATVEHDRVLATFDAGSYTTLRIIPR